MEKRTIAFVGSTKKDLKKLPVDVREIFTYAIDMASRGKTHKKGKVLKGFKGANVVEIKADYKSDTFRAIYTIKHKEFLYVLQIFKKKSSKGISLSKKDRELLEIRIKTAKGIITIMGDQLDEEVTIGSGNIFADLGVPNPEEALIKAELASQIDDILQAENITQKEAAEILGIDQPKVSDIINGKLRHYSIDRLMRFLRRLGKDIEIHVVSKVKKRRPASIKVKASRKGKSSVQKRRKRQAKVK